nr:MAG TPA: hypothetical protein [Caudoviricetes sp.]
MLKGVSFISSTLKWVSPPSWSLCITSAKTVGVNCQRCTLDQQAPRVSRSQ